MTKVRSESRQESSRANANQLARKDQRGKESENLPVQKKVAVGKAGDKYEQEADRIADQVVNNKKVDTKQQERKKEEQPIQKKEEEKEQPVKGIQKKETEEKEESHQTKIQKKEEEKEPVQAKGEMSSPKVASKLKDTKGKGHPLPGDTLRYMESRMGADFSGVRIHTGPEAAQLNREVGAQAFTHGRNIYFNEGKYNPDSSDGRWLLAHELTHTIQQGASSKSTIQRKESTQTDVEAPQSTTSLKKALFQPNSDVINYLDNKGHSGGDIKVGLGSFASGTIKVRKTGETTYDTVGKRENIPINIDFLKPLESFGQPVIGVKINKSKITGYATLKVGNKVFENPNVILDKMRTNTEAMGWFGMDKITIPKSITNEIKEGQLHFGSENIKVRVGGFIDANLKLGLINDAPIFEVDSTIKVPKLKPVHLSIKRDKAGRMSGRASAEVDIANFNGAIDVKYLDGIVDIKGVVGYNSEKMRGKIHILVTDYATAKNAAIQELGPENIAQSKEKNTGEKEGKPKPKTGKRALAGWGEVEFSFTDWMTGRAKVIVGPDGHITVFGEMNPPNEVELFPQKDIIRPIFFWELRATYGIPLLGNAFFYAKIGMDAMAKIGPGKLYNISVIGRYSTDPRVFKAFSIQGTMNISAFAGARIRAEGGLGVSIIGHDIKVGLGVEALAGIRGYVEATPTIGYREKADPKEGKKGEYFIKGYMEIGAQPFLGLGGDLFVELDAPWWSPIFDKKWVWPLGSIEYPLPGEFAMGANLDYVIGSDNIPEIQFDEVEFDKDKFMSDLMDDKMPKKKGDREDKKGKFQDGKKKPGLNKPKVKGGGGKKGDPKPKQEDGKPLTPAEMKAWGKGLEKLKDIAEESKSKPLDEESINAKLQKVKGFDSVKAEPQGQEWKLRARKGSMTNKKKPILAKGIIPPESENEKKDKKGKKGIRQRLKDGISKGKEKVKEVTGKFRNWWKRKKVVKAGKKKITISLKGSEDKPKVIISMSPGVSYSEHLAKLSQSAKRDEAIEVAREIESVEKRGKRSKTSEANEQHAKDQIARFSKLAGLIKKLHSGTEKPISEIKFGSLKNQMATSMTASVLSAMHPKGSGVRDDSKMMTQLKVWELSHTLGEPNYVQGHLLNNNLGGPGSLYNLSPITNRANRNHSTKVEEPIKKFVKHGEPSGTGVVYYRVKTDNRKKPNFSKMRKLENEQTSGYSKSKLIEERKSIVKKYLTKEFKITAYELENANNKWVEKKGGWKPNDKKYHTIKNE